MTPLRWFVLIILGTILASIGLMALAVHAQAHDWYTDKQSAAGQLCCGGTDCATLEPDQWSFTANGFTIRWRDGKTYSLPVDQVMPTEDAQGRAAACVWGGALKCAFAPFSY